MPVIFFLNPGPFLLNTPDGDVLDPKWRTLGTPDVAKIQKEKRRCDLADSFLIY